VIFSPHPRSKRTTFEMVRVMREAISRQGAPADLFQCIENPSVALTQYLMANCDLTLATGGQPMVRAAYSSGRPAYGVGAGNSTMVIDETADIDIAARNTRMSKTSDFGSGLFGRRQHSHRLAHLRRIRGRRSSRKAASSPTRHRQTPSKR
jgi:sulfoacetaldehyde dehydrogenase